MSVSSAALVTLNSAVDSLHVALEAVLVALAAGEELVFTEDSGQNSAAQTVKAHGTRRIVGYSPTSGRPEAAGHLANSLDSMRALFAEGDFSSTDAA